MRRRWIAAGLVLVALVATLAVLVLGRSEAPYPTVLWYCAATGEVREAPRGTPRPDLFAALVSLPGSRDASSFAAGSKFHPQLLVFLRTPSLAERAIAWVTLSAPPISSPGYHATDTVETADGRSWERFDIGMPIAQSPR